MRASGRRYGRRPNPSPCGAAPSSPRATSCSTERSTAGARRPTPGPGRSCGGSRSDRAWWGTRSHSRAPTENSTWPSTPGSAATGSSCRGTSGRMTRRTCGRRRTSCRTSPGIRAKEGSYGSSPSDTGARGLRRVRRTRRRTRDGTRGARLRGRRHAAGGRPSGLRESLPRRPTVGGGGGADVRRDELRRLSRGRSGRLGGPQPARRPLALRRLRWRDLPVDLLRPTARHAGVRRPLATRRDLETRDLPPVARAAGERAVTVVEIAVRLLGGSAGAVLLAVVLWDAFETIILPRRVSGRIRITKLFYRSTWIPWRATARALSGRRRDAFLSFFGPLSLILLLALWAHRADPGTAAVTELLRDWERWAADVLESHLSYPPLAYFRSQHYNESWLAALTTILDTSAVVMIGLDGWCARQAELTFAMARHAVVDLAQVFSTPPQRGGGDAAERLSAAQVTRLRARLAGGGLSLRERPDFEERLTELRRMYEPYVAALAHYLAVPLPPWVREVERPDNWQTSAWDRVVRLPARGTAAGSEEGHF